MIQLKEYELYHRKDDGSAFTLLKDIRGLWYLSNRTQDEIKDMPLIREEVHMPEDKMIKYLELYYTLGLSQEEKARRYDDLHGWYLWLKRRTHDGRTAKSHVEVFLKGFGEVFKKGE